MAETGVDTAAGTSASPWGTLQKAAATASAGDTVWVRPGTYTGKIVVSRSGSAAAGFITFRAANGPGTATFSGSGLNLNHSGLIAFSGNQYVRFDGFEITGVSGSDVSGVRLLGGNDHIEILNCHIHNIGGTNAMGITAYGTSPTPISNLRIEGNHIHHCDAYPSETLTLNGNVTNFLIADNNIHDCNYIGIDLIGGETSIQPNSALVARNGVVRGNIVERCLSPASDAVGIYVDGGQYITIERNLVRECDVGMQVGAENAGITANHIYIQSNVIAKNEGIGLILGAEDSTQGQTSVVWVLNNLFYYNDTANDWAAEILIEWAINSGIESNIFYVDPRSPQGLYWENAASGRNHYLKNNHWWGSSSINFTWAGTDYEQYSGGTGFAGAGLDPGGAFSDPQLIDGPGGNYHLKSTSPCIDTGASGNPLNGLDWDRMPRVFSGAVDKGPDEYRPVDSWLRGKFTGITDYIGTLEADADGDGMPTGLEYIMGTDPTLGSSVAATTASFVVVDGHRSFQLGYPQHPTAAGFYLYVENSDQLLGWTDSGSMFSAPFATGPALPGGAIPMAMRSLAIGAGGDFFHRLRAVFY